jgi:hypothetical protein
MTQPHCRPAKRLAATQIADSVCLASFSATEATARISSRSVRDLSGPGSALLEGPMIMPQVDCPMTGFRPFSTRHRRAWP